MTRVVVISDTHINSSVGLCPPVVELDDGGSYRPSKGQRELYKAFLDFCNKAYQTDDKVYVILNGDLAEDGFKSTQVISRNKATILNMVIDTLSPLVDRAEKVFVIRGTEYHVGKSAELEEAYAKDLDNAVRYQKKIASWWHLRTKISGVRFDVAHHISMGLLPWSEKNAANKLSAILMYQYAEWGDPLPHIALRSHVHRTSDSGRNYPIHSETLPCWCLATSYVHRIGGSNAKPKLGGLIIDCDKGKYNIDVQLYEPFRDKILNIS